MKAHTTRNMRPIAKDYDGSAAFAKRRLKLIVADDRKESGGLVKLEFKESFRGFDLGEGGFYGRWFDEIKWGQRP